VVYSQTVRRTNITAIVQATTCKFRRRPSAIIDRTTKMIGCVGCSLSHYCRATPWSLRCSLDWNPLVNFNIIRAASNNMKLVHWSVLAKLSNIPPTFKISSFPFRLCHCLVTHLSASDSFTTMALYKSIYYLRTYLLTSCCSE